MTFFSGEKALGTGPLVAASDATDIWEFMILACPSGGLSFRLASGDDAASREKSGT